MSPQALPTKKNSRRPSKFTLVAGLIGAALFAPLTASASMVAYDGFEYNISGGAGLAGKGSAGDGWDTTWSGSGTIVEDNMTYSAGTIAVNGGSQSLRINGNAEVYFSRQFETIGTAGEDIYFSFLFKEVTGGTDDFLNFWISHDADRSNSAGIGVLTTSYRRFGARIHENGTTSTGTQTGPNYVAGDTYLLVGRISRDGTAGATPTIFDRVDLWVNPESSTLGAADITINYSSLVEDSVGMSFFGLHTTNVAGGDIRIDELRIGTSAAGVLSTIPEPSSYAVIFGGVALLCGLRRRHTPRVR